MWHAEYVFRVTFGGGLTHWDYLDEPKGAVRWLMEIHRRYKEAERAEIKRMQAGRR